MLEPKAPGSSANRAHVAVPDLQEYLCRVLAAGLSDGVSRVTAGYETPNGVPGRTEVARRAISAIVLENFPRAAQTVPMPSRVATFVAKRDDDREVLLIFRKVKIEFYLSMVDFLRVEYRLGASRLRLRRDKLPPWKTREFMQRANEIDMHGLALGTFTVWEADGVRVGRPATIGDPFVATFERAATPRDYLGRANFIDDHGPRPLPSLYQLSNVAFPLNPDLLDERDWASIVPGVAHDDGLRTAWLKHVSREIEVAKRNMRKSRRARGRGFGDGI